MTLEKPVKIGRCVAKTKPSSNNAIFDCKVLSRNHALIWFSDDKVFMRLLLCLTFFELNFFVVFSSGSKIRKVQMERL